MKSEVAACGDGEKTEVERMKCVGDIMFRAGSEEDETPKSNVILHFYSGTGWGNYIRGLWSAFSYGATLGRRLECDFPAFLRTFLPPSGADHWRNDVFK